MCDQHSPTARAASALASIRKAADPDEPAIIGPTDEPVRILRIYDGKLCQECLDNNDPDALPVHPNCRCEPATGDARGPAGPSPTGFGHDRGGGWAPRFVVRGAAVVGRGYLVPEFPGSEITTTARTVVAATVRAIETTNIDNLHRSGDTQIAAWVTGGRATVGVVRHLTTVTAARRLGQGLNAPVINLTRRTVTTVWKTASPALVVLPRIPSDADRLAFIAAVHDAGV